MRRNASFHNRAAPPKRIGVLAIVPCGKSKIWSRNFLAGPTPAKDAYVSPLFKLHRRYAESFATEWRILSAWHGFLHPEQLIEDYEAKFLPSDLKPKNWWRLEGLCHQARRLPQYEHVILLGGRLYRDIAKRALLGVYLTLEISEPFRGHSLFPNDACSESSACFANRTSEPAMILSGFGATPATSFLSVIIIISFSRKPLQRS